MRLLTLFLVATVTQAATPPLLWPKPRSVSLAAGAPIHFSDLAFTGAEQSAILGAAAARYRALILTNAATDTRAANVPYPVQLRADDPDAPLSPGETDESYLINTTAAGASIEAPTVWGVLRGMETFSQLVSPAAGAYALPSPSIRVSDAPRFKWRGLMLDTSRNFLTPTSIKMALDGMACARRRLAILQHARNRRPRAAAQARPRPPTPAHARPCTAPHRPSAGTQSSMYSTGT
jgi:hexosaminidase